MTDHHCTCEECERRRRQAGDEAFATMVVLAQFHPEWFHFGEHHGHDHGHHDIEALADDDLDDDLDEDLDHRGGLHHDGFDDGDLDDMAGFDLW